MQDIPIEQITKRFQSLPEGLQNAVFSENTANAILKNCALRDIPENKVPLIGQLLTRVLMGYLRPENFADEIQKETGVDGVRVAQVAHDIDTEIFSNVRLELKKLYPPTIQTPTVQAQGFVRQAPEVPSVAARRAPEPARPYVVPIPEKFRTKSIWPASPSQRGEPASLNQGEPTPQPPQEKPAPAKEEAVSVVPVPTTPPTPVPSPVPQQNVSAPKTPPSTPLSDMKPVVPLPTFIQSKFKETLKQTTGEKQTTQKDPALKNAFTKFASPHTAIKSPDEKPKESIYHEPITESQKQQEGSPADKSQQRAEGKVIDLSGL